ncbi:hypothetical protein NECAME_16232 [Necator americanus]|uniref:Uncharacterized protein n=1 Tax=Necator americanus TaxID=51031 RepID=W2TZX5_NECAM|nr:hypothetical protein NECAME_16232 [Necator americanus]ETN86631.1 hypothetical protein NECAME_16232 [Necator americanus]
MHCGESASLRRYPDAESSTAFPRGSRRNLRRRRMGKSRRSHGVHRPVRVQPPSPSWFPSCYSQRTGYPVVPPKMEYQLTNLGFTLSAALFGVVIRAANNLDTVEKARRDFDYHAAG